MNQTSNNNGSEAETVRQNAAQLMHDLVTLAELQARLLVTDGRDGIARIMQPAAILAGGILLLLGTIPLCLAAIAFGLISAGLPPTGAFGLVACASLITAAALVVRSWRRLKTSRAMFARSRQELVRNIAWIKSAFPDMPRKPEQAATDSRNPQSN